MVARWSTVPAGFTSNAAQAEAAAKASPTMQMLHRRMRPLTVSADVWAGRHWAVYFLYRGRIIAEADVSGSGRLQHVWTGPLASTVYARGHYAPLFDSGWVVVPFTLAFLVPFLDPRRLRSRRHLDAMVLVSFLVSYWLFDHGHLEPAVWL